MQRAAFVKTPTGSRYHRPGCVEVDEYKAKNGTVTVTFAQVRKQRLQPCQTCQPSGHGLTVVA